GQTGGGYPRGGHRLKAKSLARVQALHPESARLVRTQLLYLNPLHRQGSPECLRPYHIHCPPHKPRRLPISPATKTRPPCAGSRPACRPPITSTPHPHALL